MTLVAIRSIQHPGRFLRLDGNGVTSATGPGGGKATAQVFVKNQETFVLHTFGGTVSFESLAFPGVFLRLDAGAVRAGSITNLGSGTVNGQYGADDWERFYIRKKENDQQQTQGVVGIESRHFLGRFLRIFPDGVNVQGIFGHSEELEILVIG